MSRHRTVSNPRVRRLPAVTLALCAALLGFQQGARALPQPSDALRFFSNFFVTGGYVVAGVGLWESGDGVIDMSRPAPPLRAAPEGAEVLAAYLYWQVVTAADPDAVELHAAATFNGAPLGAQLGRDLAPTAVGLGGNQACPLNGGGGRKVYTFRADVQRFLDVDVTSGRRVVDKRGGYHVSLPHSENARTLGASLVMVYRHPDPSTPLNAIVMYDGTFVKQQPATLHQRIEGFYDAASVPGQVTYIAGSAQRNLREVLRLDTDGNPATPPANVSDLFDGAAGDAWDNVTRQTPALTGLARTAGFFDTAIAPRTTGPLGFVVNDCLSMGAIIYRTAVNDGDHDGLLDKWESSAVPLTDPNGRALPDFRGMGADKDRKDVFIEVAAMRAPAGTTYGSDDAPMRESLHAVTDDFGHIHMPPPAVLQMLGEEFAAQNVRLHFDVGHPESYHALTPPSLPPGAPNPYASPVADTYIIGAGGDSGSDPALARGGELVEETACDPQPQVVDCQFPDYPGTVGWKRGFQLYKHRLFDANRKDSFRFGFYAHAKAAPKSLLPCLGVSGPAGFDEAGNCAGGVANPLIHVPAGVSGTADFPGGGDFLVTLGLWDNTTFVGSDFSVAATTMHELGHTFGLGHGGNAMPNCKPNYLSVMNYLFQLGGLVDAAGVPHLGYSTADYLDLSETALSETYTVPGPFRTSWYAPWSAGDPGTPAKRFCNGLRYPEGTPSMARIDGVPGGPIDWNGDGDTDDTGFTQDINFDGEPDAEPGGPTTVLTGFDDWAALRLNQVGSRRNFAGFSIGPLGVELLADGSELLADGSKILADGSWLLADGSELLADGSVFLGDGAELLADGAELLADGSKLLADGSRILADGVELLADGAVLLADGHILLADGSVFLADGAEFLADGSVFLGDGVTLLADGSIALADDSPLLADDATFAWAQDVAEPTPQLAAESGIAPGPTALAASVITDVGPTLHRVALSWTAPATGDVLQYRIYRAAGAAVVAEEEISVSPVAGAMTAAVDGDELPNGEFTYVVEAVLADGEGSVTPRSNAVTILAVNTPPVAESQAAVVWEDWASPITLVGLDPDTAGLAFATATGTTLGTLAGAPPNLSYLSPADYNGADGFSFTVSESTTWGGHNQSSEPAAVAITVTPVNDKPTFTHAGNQIVVQPAGAQTRPGWVTGFDAGPPDEDLTQAVSAYLVSNDNPALFAVQPAVAANGTLTYTPAPGATGSATVSVRVRDTGGTAEGHGAVDTSDAQVFTITVDSVAIPLAFAQANVWLTSSVASMFDLKAQVLRNGVVVAERELLAVALGHGTSVEQASLRRLGPLLPTVPNFFSAQDVLSVRLWARVSPTGGGASPAAADVRVWYNMPTVDPLLAAGNLRATRANVEARYFMVEGFRLQPVPVAVGSTPRHAAASVAPGGGYKELGTWSVTGP